MFAVLTEDTILFQYHSYTTQTPGNLLPFYELKGHLHAHAHTD